MKEKSEMKSENEGGNNRGYKQRDRGRKGG